MQQGADRWGGGGCITSRWAGRKLSPSRRGGDGYDDRLMHEGGWGGVGGLDEENDGCWLFATDGA